MSLAITQSSIVCNKQEKTSIMIKISITTYTCVCLGCGNFIYFNSIAASMTPSYLLSPGLIAPTGQQCISFYVNMYSMTSSEMGTLTVYFVQQTFLDQSGVLVQEVVWESSPDLTATPTSWHKVNIDLNNIDNRNYYFVRHIASYISLNSYV